MDVKELTREECMGVVAAGRLAHLACCRGELPYVIPIYYALDGNYLYSFSMVGKKIEWLRENPHACLLIEQFKGEHGWASVLISGQYQELPDTEQWHQERIHAWSLLEHHTNWWEPGALKPQAQPLADHYSHVFYSIGIEEITGRSALPGDPWNRDPSNLQE
ncbi:pyridoxamine 5'-phosphate oxidase family protein [Rhizobiaceae bacterium n13]|uniref:Pyridoxamine 5'-phosphate oxidase family protein n=1 Tax=Ferirhizobium litorale TaxID=2927786 RepID=A0AAE3U664_9HYPH|nr:pyridoxamine 5'-phosphate oxidase family protein [Fererhizobium litorale]MDI7864470.1 pyridoxamine 5'-phosphate oxidase family protein [Fererhizobium litorale]MDI7924779.1 pyridoxamine 5'-phosphate oxidase family protein [Fererhizobium litorale]